MKNLIIKQINLQFFASKKGVGSTKNGRDSNPKYLGAKNQMVNLLNLVKLFIDKEEQEFTQEKMLV